MPGTHVTNWRSKGPFSSSGPCCCSRSFRLDEMPRMCVMYAALCLAVSSDSDAHFVRKYTLKLSRRLSSQMRSSIRMISRQRPVDSMGISTLPFLSRSVSVMR